MSIAPFACPGVLDKYGGPQTSITTTLRRRRGLTERNLLSLFRAKTTPSSAEFLCPAPLFGFVALPPMRDKLPGADATVGARSKNVGEFLAGARVSGLIFGNFANAGTPTSSYRV